MKRKEPKFRNQHVMIVDDSELDNFINEKIIESSHFSKKVYVNTGSKSALEFIKNLKLISDVSEDIFPNVIFIDLNMPIIDGFQFINYLKDMNCDRVNGTKLVILTSSVHPEDRKKANAISSDITFLNKPLTEQMLAAI
jgi:CheY-like chemotaxis protein